MTTPRKTTAKPKANLKVVDNSDLDQAEARAETEWAAEKAPMINRAGAALEKMEARLKEIRSELEALKAREDKIDRLHEAVKTAVNRDRRDLEKELDLYENGINGLSTQVAKAAAE